ncbi:hypothetical protein GCM10009801_27660 [Streptomyces albiaxialis]|uniref:DUF3040 domain-containing protein n=1 Tax=Streptomyces albiaxialis TaxID=329523 RepID=A0ABN2VV54_9ACTN
MRLPDRKEREVRRLIDGVQPLPPDLAERALAVGTRLARRRRVLRTGVSLLLLVALLALAVWTLAYDPWSSPPPETSPTVGW